MELIFLGTSAGVPTRTRNVTAILLNLQHPTQSGLWLFDCGEGTQHQLLHTAFNPGKLDKIFYQSPSWRSSLWFTRLAVQSFYVRHYPTLNDLWSARYP